MIRILQVIGGMNRNGAETMLMNLYRKIEKKEIQFDFLVYGEESFDYSAEIKQLGGRIINIPTRVDSGSIRHIQNIRQVIKNYGPYKAVHAHTLHNCAYAMIASKLEKIDIRISHSHNTSNGNSNIIKKTYENLTKIIIQKFSNQYVACSRDAGVYLFGEKFLENGQVINNSVDSNLFLNVDAKTIQNFRNNLKLSNNRVILGNIARMDPVKNHVFMIKLAERLKKDNVPFYMLFVGDGDLRKELEEKVENKELQDNVICLGKRSDIPLLINMFDYFIMPSHFEGLPVTLIEAQASGTECIISDTITKDVDLGLDLINYLSIDEDNIDKWVTFIKNSKPKKILNSNIKRKMEEKGYDIACTIKGLIKLYQ